MSRICSTRHKHDIILNINKDYHIALNLYENGRNPKK